MGNLMQQQSLKILVVEDNENDYIIVRDLLSDIYEEKVTVDWVETYAGYQEAIRVCRHDVILLDYRLAAHTGLEILREAQAQGCQIPLIMMTGQGDEGLDTEALQAGAADYLDKNNLTCDLLERVIRYSIERKRAAEAIFQRETRFRALIEHSSDVISLMDTDGVVIYTSDSTTRILGYSKEEFINCHAFELIHPDDQAHFRELLSELIHQPGHTMSGIYRFQHKDGTWLWMESVATNLLHDPSVRAIVANHRNITQRREAETALQRSEERFRALMERSTDLLVLMDTAVNITYISPSVTRVLGYSVEALTGRSGLVLVAPEDVPVLTHTITSLIEQPGASLSLEMRMRHEDGTWRSMYGVVTNLLMEPSVQAIAGNFHDITALKQAEVSLKAYASQLERSNRDLQDFAYVASHDLQEPLRKIKVLGDKLLMEHQEALNEDGSDYLQRMAKATTRMQTLIKDLLELSRIATTAQPFVPVDLNQIAAEVICDMEMRIERDGGYVEVSQLPTIYADPLQMRQLLQNLISNALKFHKPDDPPLVRINSESLAVQPDRFGDVPVLSPLCQIIVEDNGIGFDEKHAERIFTPFQRLHGRQKYEGTGIGLAICRKIAERHGGSITARSTPGQGTTFIITIPSHESTESDLEATK